jgi:hypothetical protein
VGWKLWLWILSGDLAGVAFVYFLCPETGGKTLEQVDYLFIKNGMPAFAERDVGKDGSSLEDEKRDMKVHIEV